MAPFDLVLSRPPGPLALKAQPTTLKDSVDYKTRWKAWLEKTLSEASAKLRSSQDRYKRNYHKRLRKDREVINPGLYVFLRTEKKDNKDSRHKLAPLAEGPYLVKEVDVDSKTVVIEYGDHTVERVSRSRVVLAPKRLTPAQLQNVIRPSVMKETLLDYPAP